MLIQDRKTSMETQVENDFKCSIILLTKFYNKIRNAYDRKIRLFDITQSHIKYGYQWNRNKRIFVSHYQGKRLHKKQT